MLIASGLIGYCASKLLPNVSVIAVYKYPIEIISIIALLYGVYVKGGLDNEEKHKNAAKDAEIVTAKKETKVAELNTKIEIAYVDKIKFIKEKGDVIIKENTKYVTVYDNNCQLPTVAILLHDAAAANEIPKPAALADETTSKVKLSTYTGTVARNYTTYYEVAEQLEKLQEWVVKVCHILTPEQNIGECPIILE